MAIAEYRDWCLDAVEPARLGAFWGGLLGLTPEADGADVCLSGVTPFDRVWVNRVPEARTVKHRVHVDVNVPSLDLVTGLGAEVVDADSFPWTVLRDPEGGEFCAFVRPGPRFHEIVVDSVDPAATAGWWSRVLGGAPVHHDQGWSRVSDIPNTPFSALSFVPVPEPKAVKNRIHIDVTTRDLDALREAGASPLTPSGTFRWNVMADPEGNEFCAFVVA